MITPADHSFHFDPNDDVCPTCDAQMAGALDCQNCGCEHPDRYYEVNDEMVERAWAAIVGFDVAGQCFVASLTRADLRAGIVAALAFANGKPSAGSQLEGVASVNSEAREAGSNLSSGRAGMSRTATRNPDNPVAGAVKSAPLPAKCAPVSSIKNISDDALFNIATEAWSAQTDHSWSSDGLEAAILAVRSAIEDAPALSLSSQTVFQEQLEIQKRAAASTVTSQQHSALGE